MSEIIRLTLPKDERYHGVAHLVVGGLATRLQFSYEHLEDLQLALDSFLGNESYAAGDEVIVELRVREDGIELRAGPVADALRADLERDVAECDGVGLARLLSTVAESVEIEEAEGVAWLRLKKRRPGRSVTTVA